MRLVRIVTIRTVAAVEAQILSPAQQERLMLPDVQQVSGFVTDPGGAPIPDVRIPGQGERDSGVNAENDSGVKTNRIPG